LKPKQQKYNMDVTSGRSRKLVGQSIDGEQAAVSPIHQRPYLSDLESLQSQPDRPIDFTFSPFF
jgi:hypothetical protein